LFDQDSVVSADIEKYLLEPIVVNEAPAKPFEMRELLVAVRAMEYNKAPGNNGMNIEVYAFVESELLLIVLLERTYVCTFQENLILFTAVVRYVLIPYVQHLTL
jgi:hypothetical protein